MENRKLQITDLAMVNIREKGYLSFSYDDLAKALNVTKASIHYHFIKKEDLGLAICTRIEEGLIATYSNVTQMNTNSEEKLWAFFFNRVAKIENNEICPLSSLQADYNYLPDSMQKRIHDLSELEIEYVQNLLKEIKDEDNQVQFKDAEELAALLTASLKGALQYRRVLGSEFLNAVSKQLRQMLDMYRENQEDNGGY